MAQQNTTMIGHSAELQNIINSNSIIAATDVSVLILGESGTGKELIAQQIQQQSPRHKKPFIQINCAALPETLIESELFGHTKGAFTGADSNRDGKIKSAHTGTLFLDEVAELPLSVQAKILRFLESGECQKLGTESIDIVDVRVIAATNQNLLNAVQKGTFREDLYFRLNVVPIKLPALRDRVNDVKPLLEYYSQFFSQQHKLSAISFSKTCCKVLENYGWPGNIRELKNFVERLAILFSGNTIEPSNLPDNITSPNTLSTIDVFSLPDQGIKLDELESHFIQQALQKTNGNQSRAARLLGLTRDTLLYRMKKHTIPP